MNNKLLKLIIGVFIVLIAFNKYIFDSMLGSNNIESLLLVIFSFVPTSSRFNLNDIFISLIHVIYILYIFSNNFQYKLLDSGPYIFTRTNKRTKYILKSYINLFINLTIYFLILYLIMILIGYFNGYVITDIMSLITISAILLISNIVSIYSMILIICTLSLYFEFIYGYIGQVTLLICNVLLINLYINSHSKKILMFMPFSQHFITLKDINIIDRSIHINSKFIENFGFSTGLFIGLIITIIMIAISIKRFNYIDIR